MRLVYYSLVNIAEESRERQWIQSIRSLRLYNPAIPVWLFLFNGANTELLREAERWRVQVRLLGDYDEFLQRIHARGSVLALYPTLHKFLVLRNLPLQGLKQILYLDCDTFFFGDVDRLFDRHTEHELYAREEPLSVRSHLGYDANHVDESLLGSIAQSEGLRYIAPFNSGVCLLNHSIWQKLIDLRKEMLDLAWRLLCGRESSGRDEAGDPPIRQAVRKALTDSDRLRALPYPSANGWIVEQIALWLALGRLPHFSLGTLPPRQVSQGAEHETMLTPDQQCVVAHYFSGGEKEFFAVVSPISA